MKWVSSRRGREGAIKDPPFPQVYVVGGKEREAIGGSAGNWVARKREKPKFPVSENGGEVGEVFLSLVTPSMAPLPFIDFF